MRWTRPYTSITAYFLITRLVIIFSSSNWVIAWAGIELNILCFLPFCLAEKTKQAEGFVKYFLSQTIGRVIVLLGVLTIKPYSRFILCVGLILKLGLAPLHFWFTAFFEYLTWWICFLSATIQKFPYLCLISTLNNQIILFVILTATLTVIWAALAGWNQRDPRLILAYSSISHAGWITLLFCYAPIEATSYFIIYSLLTIAIFSMLHGIFFFELTRNTTWLLVFFSFLLSLGGLPPFIGFSIKWIALYIVANESIWLAFILLIGALIRLVFYINLFWIFFTKSISYIKEDRIFLINWQSSIILPSLVTLNLSGLIPYIIFFNWY